MIVHVEFAALRRGHAAPVDLGSRTQLPGPVRMLINGGPTRLAQVSRTQGLVGQLRDCCNYLIDRNSTE